MQRQRTSSTIPFGYELGDDNKTLKPIDTQLDVLRNVSSMVKDNVLSLREGSPVSYTHLTLPTILHV